MLTSNSHCRSTAWISRIRSGESLYFKSFTSDGLALCDLSFDIIQATGENEKSHFG